MGSIQDHSHAEINASELLHTHFHRLVQTLRTSDVDRANAQHLGAGASRHERPGHGLGLLDVATDDAGVGAEVDQGSDLGAADGAVAAGAEDHLVF